MNVVLLIILIVVGLLVFGLIIDLFTLSLNDVFEKNIKRFLWLWLPFHAFGRLKKELKEKYKK